MHSSSSILRTDSAIEKIDRQYTLCLVRILQCFSAIFCLEDSELLQESVIDLSDLEKCINLNSEIFNKALEDGDIDFNLKQAKRAYSQVVGYFQIIKSHYDNVLANERQFALLAEFKAQLEEQIEMLEALL